MAPLSPCQTSGKRTRADRGRARAKPVDIDEVIRSTGVATRNVHIVLLELDLAGKLQRHGQQLVSLIEG